MKKLFAVVLAAALMLGVAAVPARAYFTASDEANGGMVIKGPDTNIIEEYGNGLKEVTIVNNEKSVPVWVRAKAFIPAALKDGDKESVSGTGWTKLDDGDDDPNNNWWQYDEILQPGEAVKNPLLVKVEWSFTATDVDADGIVTQTIIGTTTGTDQGGEDGGTSKVVINKADGTNYNIVVVYEAQPVKYDADGTTVLDPVWNN